MTKPNPTKAMVIKLRRRMHKRWKRVARERLDAVSAGRSCDAREAAEEMKWIGGYYQALQDVLKNL